MANFPVAPLLFPLEHKSPFPFPSYLPTLPQHLPNYYHHHHGWRSDVSRVVILITETVVRFLPQLDNFGALTKGYRCMNHVPYNPLSSLNLFILGLVLTLRAKVVFIHHSNPIFFAVWTRQHFGE